MRFLFFDTETTGVSHQDHIVQLGAVLTNDKGKILGEMDMIVKPDGYAIPKGATAVHGISTQKAIEEGERLENVLGRFLLLVEQSDCLVAHNMDFDRRFVNAAFGRLENWDAISLSLIHI